MGDHGMLHGKRHLNKDFKGGIAIWLSGREYSRNRKQPVQRPWGKEGPVNSQNSKEGQQQSSESEEEKSKKQYSGLQEAKPHKVL